MKIRPIFILSLWVGVFASAFGVSPPPMVHAAIITVDTLSDETDGSCSDGDCSLRDTLAIANDGDTITFGHSARPL
jgi:CSLREA domain-containing protein